MRLLARPGVDNADRTGIAKIKPVNRRPEVLPTGRNEITLRFGTLLIPERIGYAQNNVCALAIQDSLKVPVSPVHDVGRQSCRSQHTFHLRPRLPSRSEERRVGKEGRSRWSPCA